MTACIRGANTVENNNKEEMLEATEKMLKAIMEENNIENFAQNKRAE